MDHLYSYPSIYNFGHSAVRDLITREVQIEEKVDGSQFSFGITLEGELVARSKGKQIVLDAPDKMFTKAVETVQSLKDSLRAGYIYRGEYLSKPKHNSLTYGRVPEKHIILFDVCAGVEEYLSADERRSEAARIGLECVPVIATTTLTSYDQFKDFMEIESCLGGCKVEGVVIKPASYDIYGQDKKVVMAKYVSEAFKEIHSKEWKNSNPSGGDILQQLQARYKTEARWEKAVQHLRDNGELKSSPQDIGALLKEIELDLEKEIVDDMSKLLVRWAMPHVVRGVKAGLPEWYKDKLVKDTFNDQDS